MMRNKIRCSISLCVCVLAVVCVFMWSTADVVGRAEQTETIAESSQQVNRVAQFGFDLLVNIGVACRCSQS